MASIFGDTVVIVASDLACYVQFLLVRLAETKLEKFGARRPQSDDQGSKSQQAVLEPGDPGIEIIVALWFNEYWFCISLRKLVLNNAAEFSIKFLLRKT